MGLRRKRPTGKACWARPGPKPKAKNEPSAHGAPQGTAHDQRSWARRSRKSPRLPLEPTARVYVRRRGNVVPEETYVHERRRRENTNVAYVRPRPSPKEMGSSERSEEIRNVRAYVLYAQSDSVRLGVGEAHPEENAFGMGLRRKRPNGFAVGTRRCPQRPRTEAFGPYATDERAGGSRLGW